MSQQRVATARGPVEYRLEGAGPVVVVLNGGHCSRESRLSHERLSTEGFSVLTPSRPGYDGTPVETGSTAQQAADAIAALLDTLGVQDVDLIGISAAGPTALAFAQRHPGRTRRLILESAKTTDWDEALKRPARLLFGRLEAVTWWLVRTMLRVAPRATVRTILRDLTTLDVDTVMAALSVDDRAFVERMIRSCRSGRGFMADIGHHLDGFSGIAAPVLFLYSQHDATVSSEDASRVAAQVPTAVICEIPADTHLIWIGKTAEEVWRRRLEFLRSELSSLRQDSLPAHAGGGDALQT
jgi:pimeloyl-ACP methyl ester carboxylesterase